MPHDADIEELADRGELLLFARISRGQFLHVAANMGWCDGMKLKAAAIAPSQESYDRSTIARRVCSFAIWASKNSSQANRADGFAFATMSGIDSVHFTDESA